MHYRALLARQGHSKSETSSWPIAFSYSPLHGGRAFPSPLGILSKALLGTSWVHLWSPAVERTAHPADARSSKPWRQRMEKGTTSLAECTAVGQWRWPAPLSPGVGVPSTHAAAFLVVLQSNVSEWFVQSPDTGLWSQLEDLKRKEVRHLAINPSIINQCP